MARQIHIAYLLLVLAQAAHSIEEYIGRLWENFPPATYLCSLISDDLEKGFLIINFGLFVFGIGSWYFLVRKNHITAPIVIWFWIIIELINGVGHPIWAIVQGRYQPGVITAPLLLIIAILLLRSILNRSAPLKSEL